MTTNDVHSVEGCKGERQLVDDLNIHSSWSLLLCVLPVEDGSAILVQLNSGDNDVAGVDSNRGACAVRLVSLHTVDMDDPLLAVDLDDLALTTLEFSADNSDFIIFADR